LNRERVFRFIEGSGKYAERRVVSAKSPDFFAFLIDLPAGQIRAILLL
jgi:hypothetical protein